MSNNKSYLTVEKTLGGLRQINLGFNQNHASISTEKFFAVKETLRVWSNYGQYNENRIHLHAEEMENELIKIGGIEFWPIIKDIHYFQLSCSNQNHIFTINGRYSDGDIFEETFRIYDDELLPSIVCAMLMISHFGKAPLAAEYWGAYHNIQGRLLYSSKGELLDKVIAFQDACQTMVEEYPFMQSMLQKCLKKFVTDLKETMDDLAILS